jgi:long-chain acyl-CoA synthetase
VTNATINQLFGQLVARACGRHKETRSNMVSWYEHRPWLPRYDEAMRAAMCTPRTLTELMEQATRDAAERRALSYLDRSVSYAELEQLSNGFACHLQDSGFAPGDRLALHMQSLPEFVVAAYGTWKAGGIVVPVNPMYRARELSYLLADSGATVLVHSGAGSSNNDAGALDNSAVSRAAEGTQVRLIRTAEDVAQLAGDAAHRLPRRPVIGVDDVALIAYTSGTSARPKGVTNTHGNIGYNAQRLTASLALPPGSVMFGLAPLFHMTGIVGLAVAAVSIGANLVLIGRFHPSAALAAIERHQPDYMVGPPTAYRALTQHPEVRPEHFTSFRVLYSGGAPLPAAFAEEFRARFGHSLRNGYGLTETSGGCVSTPAGVEIPRDPRSGLLSVGVPVPGAVVAVLDEAGEPLPPGEQGEIAVRGPMVVPGYWNRPEEDATAFCNDWFRSGDVGYMNRDGWVFVIDRKKDIINASGFKVMPGEVEEVLYAHAAVREAAVVGVPDTYRGETVRAFVSVDPSVPVTAAELIEHCRERLAAYKCPRVVEFLDELPKNASGKILRRTLRSGRTGQVS